MWMRWTAKASGSPWSPCVERGVADAEQADEVGPPALHEADVAAVIDDAGEIGVLEIDAHRQDVTAGDQAAGKVGPGLRGRHSSSPSPNSVNCAAAGPDGAARPRWRKACGVSRRPRGVRWTKPCWMRKGSTISSIASRGSESAAAMVSMPTGPPPKLSAIRLR